MQDRLYHTYPALRYKEPFLDGTRYILLLEGKEIELVLHREGGFLIDIREPLTEVLPIAACVDVC
jgi:hypothetical protein